MNSINFLSNNSIYILIIHHNPREIEGFWLPKVNSSRISPTKYWLLIIRWPTLYPSHVLCYKWFWGHFGINGSEIRCRYLIFVRNNYFAQIVSTSYHVIRSPLTNGIVQEIIVPDETFNMFCCLDWCVVASEYLCSRTLIIRINVSILVKWLLKTTVLVDFLIKWNLYFKWRVVHWN